MRRGKQTAMAKIEQLKQVGLADENLLKKIKGSDLLCRDDQKQTILHVLCAERDVRLDVIDWVLSKCPQLTTIRDVSGWTALHSACRNSADPKLLKILVRYGSDAKEPNNDGSQALHYFARHSPPKDKMKAFEESLDFLLLNGAYINQINRNGETPLHMCVLFGGSLDMFNLLLEKKADIQIINKHGESVLHYAVRSERVNIVKVLLDKGMDPREGTGVNGTVLDVAKESKVAEIKSILEAKVKDLEEPGSTTDDANDVIAKMRQKRRFWHIDYNELVVGKRIGKGAFGAVYRAQWRGTVVAMKKIHSNSLNDKEIRTFFKEINIISKLRHPNIVLFLGACLDEPNICFITEFATRGDLYTVLHNQAEELDWERKMKMSVDSARGLLYLHMCSPPVVHRDLKSLNLLVDDSYNIKLTDFGISKPLKDNLETMNSKMGTLNWLAPEVLDCKPYSPASDVYSFGIILWEIVTRETPFDGMHNFQILSAVARGQGLQIPDSCDPAFAKLMNNMWLIDPLDRPGMMEVLDTLVGIQRDLGLLSDDDSEEKPESNGVLPSSNGTSTPETVIESPKKKKTKKGTKATKETKAAKETKATKSKGKKNGGTVVTKKRSGDKKTKGTKLEKKSGTIVKKKNGTPSKKKKKKKKTK